VEAPPDQTLPIQLQVEKIMADIKAFRKGHEEAAPVLVNLLPACASMDMECICVLEKLYERSPEQVPPDLAYVLGAVLSGVPVVNFTPNPVEIPAVVQEALHGKVPLSGRDGKTGQTYLKMVLASALKARRLQVNGWYSLNILGNADGRNLMNPENAATKLMNKTDLLDEILGYSVGAQYDNPSHRVHIDYYPPRGDAKEAWDVIDFEGFLGMPMSLRVNLQGRDSILAAPLVLDLCRWMAALKTAGRAGLVPELAFFFKKPAGGAPFVTFQDQVFALENLEKDIIDLAEKDGP
jgi:myo-inositol-1-phosphate synthase